MPSESLDNTVIIAPRLNFLVKISGNAENSRPVHDFRMQGLTFSHNDWFLPPNERQGGQAAKLITGAILINWAADCQIIDCTVNHVSKFAFDLHSGCRDIRITGCTMTDLGAGGVKIGYDSGYASTS